MELASPPLESDGNDRPICSVCIANYNGIRFLGECLDAVFAQEVSFPFEVLIHDDASTDDSLAFIAENYPDVKLIRSQENVGFCVANNRMAALARGDFILLLNNDAILFPDALQTFWDEVRKIGTDAIIGLPQYDAVTGEMIDQGNLLDIFLNPIPNKDPDRIHVGMVIGACLWIPKLLWDELGGFPEWFGSIAEDMYLCCRARLIGCPVIAVPRSGYRHYVGQSFGGGKVKDNRLSTSFIRRKLSERNKSYVMVLTYPPALLHIVFPLHIVSLLFEGLILSILKHRLNIFLNIYLNAVNELWRTRKLLRNSRQKILKNSFPSARQYFTRSISLRLHKLYMLGSFGIPNIH